MQLRRGSQSQLEVSPVIEMIHIAKLLVGDLDPELGRALIFQEKLIAKHCLR